MSFATKLRKAMFAAPGFVFLAPLIASAHENYVLSKQDIDRGMADWSINVWSSLNNVQNIIIAAKFAAGLLAAWGIYYLFQRSRWGIRFDAWMKRWDGLANSLLRVVLGVSLLFSAYTHVFLGPEIPLSSIPGGEYWRIPLFIFGAMMVLGIFSRIAGGGAMIVTLLATFIYRDYMLTYFNYFGEFVALALFGSYILSADHMCDAKKIVSEKARQWEATILRVTYGISILYPAISIKLLHPSIIVEIAENYHLTDIHWLFPPDPLLISLGTGLTQIAVGLAIMIGFETRLNSAITFTLYIMSILYFREAVWPHYILLALAAYLFVNDGGEWTVDAWLAKKRKQ